jgi:hypothetical protein
MGVILPAPLPSQYYSPTPHATACKPQTTTNNQQPAGANHRPTPTPLFVLFDVAQQTSLKKYSTDTTVK